MAKVKSSDNIEKEWENNKKEIKRMIMTMVGGNKWCINFECFLFSFFFFIKKDPPAVWSRLFLGARHAFDSARLTKLMNLFEYVMNLTML